MRPTRKKRSIELIGIEAAMKEGSASVKQALQGDFTNVSKALKQQEAALKDFLTQTGLRADTTRVQVNGFGRSLSQRAVWADRRFTARNNCDILKTQGGGLTMHIDKFTPCLENAKTGEILQTLYAPVSSAELKKLRNWKFNWQGEDLKASEIFKLTISGNNQIQGLIALTDMPRDNAIYVRLAESAPHNIGPEKQYLGVGGHLFAVAARRSYDLGHNCYFYLDAKNDELVSHYSLLLKAKLLGRPHQYRMFVEEESAFELIKLYSLEGG